MENKTEYIATPTEKVVDYSKPMGPPKYTEETVKVPRVGITCIWNKKLNSQTVDSEILVLNQD